MNILKFKHTELEEFKYFLKVNTDDLREVKTSCGCSTPVIKKDGLEVIIRANTLHPVKNIVPEQLYTTKKTYQKNVTVTLIKKDKSQVQYQFQLTIQEKNNNEHI